MGRSFLPACKLATTFCRAHRAHLHSCRLATFLLTPVDVCDVGFRVSSVVWALCGGGLGGDNPPCKLRWEPANGKAEKVQTDQVMPHPAA